MEDFTKLDGVHEVWTYDSIAYEKTRPSVGTRIVGTMVQSKCWDNIQSLKRMK